MHGGIKVCMSHGYTLKILIFMLENKSLNIYILKTVLPVTISSSVAKTNAHDRFS